VSLSAKTTAAGRKTDLAAVRRAQAYLRIKEACDQHIFLSLSERMASPVNFYTSFILSFKKEEG